MRFTDIERIGVFKLRNIGDVLIITPALRALRETYPEARITAVVNSVTDAMLAGNPHIDEVIVYRRAGKGTNPLVRVWNEIRYFAEIFNARFDLSIDFTKGDRPAFSGMLSGARHRVASRATWGPGNWRNLAYTQFLPPPPLVHEVEQHLWLLEQIGVKTSDKSLCLRVGEKERAWAQALIAPMRPAKVVHVHPVARWLFKCWEDARMAEVIDWLELEKQARVIITASPDEREMEKTQKILELCRSKPLFLSGQTTLGQLAALSEQADCYFGVDTAPMHIAAAVGVPVVAVFGPTNAKSWGPWTAKQATLSKKCVCQDWAGKYCDWDQVRACLKEVTVAEAKEALERFL